MNSFKTSIMHVIDSLTIGGAERMLVDIANNTDIQAYSISVCITRSVNTLACELNENIPIKVLGRTFSFDPKGFYELEKFVNDRNVNIFHAHGRTSTSFLLAARGLGFITQPIVMHDHFGKVEIDSQVPIWFKYFGSQKIAHYIGVCDNLAKWARNAGVAPHKISVIENALDLTRFDDLLELDLHQILEIPLDKKIGIMVGNIRPEKGLDLLIEACKEKPIENIPYFVIVGKVVDKEYFQTCLSQLHELNLFNNFRFVGVQENSISWIKGADFGIHPSRSESGPLVLIEYMYCGLPFVSFNVGGISQQVSKFIPGRFVSPVDPRQLALRLEDLLQLSKADLKEESEKINKYAKNMFDIKSRIPAFTRIYDLVLGEQK